MPAAQIDGLFFLSSLALQPEDAPRLLAASQVLEGLTPADVCEAVGGVRFGRTRAERTEAVARIVCRRGAVRVSEDEAPYCAGHGHAAGNDS